MSSLTPAQKSPSLERSFVVGFITGCYQSQKEAVDLLSKEQRELYFQELKARAKIAYSLYVKEASSKLVNKGIH